MLTGNSTGKKSSHKETRQKKNNKKCGNPPQMWNFPFFFFFLTGSLRRSIKHNLLCNGDTLCPAQPSSAVPIANFI